MAKTDWLRYAELGAESARALVADFKPHLPTVLDSLLKNARARGIEVDDDWTIAKLRDELAAERG